MFPTHVSGRSAPRSAAPVKSLVWADDFNGTAGQLPSSANWTYDIGAGGWGNSELEYYTKTPVSSTTGNVSLDGNSNLQIVARNELAPDQVTQYTSARIKTQGLQEFLPPCKIASRMSVPWTKGMWPAFWTLGDASSNATYNFWPAEGEIDIHEVGLGGSYNVAGHLHVGQTGSLHTHVQTQSYAGNLLDPSNIPSWHIYGIDWYTDHVDFHIDGVILGTSTPASVASGDWTPYTGAWPQYILVDVAVGGTGGGPPDGSSVFPQTMLIDWIKVWGI